MVMRNATNVQSAGQRWALVGYVALGWVFVACIALQVFFAGLGIFVDSANWARHASFIHTFEMLPLLMLLLAFVGRLPRGRWLYWTPVGLWGLIAVQYATAHMGGSVVAALHPVSAMVLFWSAVTVARRAQRWVSGPVDAPS